ncbi:MAG: 4-alpha-glucanotransferase [Acidobacteriota bacterium]
MDFPRSSGILLHPTSLPGGFGVGDLGTEAYRFADFLLQAGQRIWQVLPLGPTGFGDSPYQSFSAFAGNPLLVSLEKLVDEGLLSRTDLESAPAFSEKEVDYGGVIDFKLPLLNRAYQNFKVSAGSADWDEFQAFCSQNHFWLEDYSLYRAIDDEQGGVEWTRWEVSISRRQGEAVRQWREKLVDSVQMRKFWQLLFFKQWHSLKKYCNDKGLSIMGDVPIFVAHDSAEVWAHRELFQLDAEGQPLAVAGVPPDYFSATGQLWGNPLYRWDVLAESGYEWWIERFRLVFSMVDLIRVDHFRGFEAYWEVPAAETTAVHGRWVKGPGTALFEAVRRDLGILPIIAENLGWITPEVEELRRRFGFPGMGVLQFAFGTDPQASDFIPHNHSRDLVIYTGTHDNDTTVGWWAGGGNGDSTRTAQQIEEERAFARRYLDTDGRQIHWDFIRSVMSSVAMIAMIPLQDVLGLGSEARMNLPGRAGGNWRWRFTSNQLNQEMSSRLRELSWLYGRTSEKSARLLSS